MKAAVKFFAIRPDQYARACLGLHSRCRFASSQRAWRRSTCGWHSSWWRRFAGDRRESSRRRRASSGCRSRRLAWSEEFSQHGVSIIFLLGPAGRSAEDELLVQVQGMIAEYERAKILERCRRQITQCGSSGVFPRLRNSSENALR